MGLSRSGTLFLIGFLVLIALSLYPVASVEAVIDRAFAPSRALAELARPFAWLERRTVAAAEEEVALAFEAERERAHAVLFASQADAMPDDPALLQGRAAVGAHVIGHRSKNHDRLRLRYPVDAGVLPGSPVVRGNVFVGRVIALDPKHPGECTAELVTARDFRVSAATGSTASGELARFVVGGVLSKTRNDDRELRLAVQYPSDRDVAVGTLRVSEDEGSPLARLADGFLLGELEWVDVRGTRLLGLVAPLDYAFGLNHLALLVPPQMGTAGPVLPIDPFEPASWVQARVILAGSVSALRETRKLALTSASQVRVGAALSLGTRFVGRIGRVGVFDSDARLLGDPGLSFSALARIAGQAAPIPLGRLVSLGADGSSGDVLFECSQVISRERAGAQGATVELWTAAAETDLPPGLLVGTAVLIGGERQFTLRVRPALDARSAQRLAVWRSSLVEDAP
ncbi:MAG: hypothetical protein JNL28_08940 [Planctomycetes bacterium]|nr:hypothetical protein [Planctomycetota bacterium]